MATLWPELREQCLEMALPPATLRKYLKAAGGPTTATELGLSVDYYREAVGHAHEMRDRFSFSDIACDGGMLGQLARAEV